MSTSHQPGLCEGIRSPAGKLLAFVYAKRSNESLRSPIRALLLRLEGGPALSLTLRDLLRRIHRVEIGLYTRWPHALNPGVFHPGTRIGRYCSIASSVRTFTRNHPMNVKSTHGFFENPALGFAKADLMDFGQVDIGDGVTIGHNALILRPTERIGEGAIIAPGSVVYSNIPPYAYASGFPARATAYRFPKEKIAELLAAQWGSKTPENLQRSLASLLAPSAPAPAASGTPIPESAVPAIPR